MKFSKFVVSSLVTVSMLALAGCGTARLVTRQPGRGGVIAIESQESSADRGKAEGIMRETCRGKRFEITEEGEVVTGVLTTKKGEDNKVSSGYTPGPYYGGGSYKIKNIVKETSNVTEWRIQFRCIE